MVTVNATKVRLAVLPSDAFMCINGKHTEREDEFHHCQDY